MRPRRILLGALYGAFDAIFINELRASGWYDRTALAFAVFLPVMSVGVMGGGHTCEQVAALCTAQAQDVIADQRAELPHGLLFKVANRIINEIRGINRVVCDDSSKLPATPKRK